MAEIEIVLANLAAAQWARRGHKVCGSTVKVGAYVAHRETIFARVRSKTRHATMAVKLWPNEMGTEKRIRPSTLYKFWGAEMVRYWMQCTVAYRHAYQIRDLEILVYHVELSKPGPVTLSIEFDEVTR